MKRYVQLITIIVCLVPLWGASLFAQQGSPLVVPNLPDFNEGDSLRIPVHFNGTIPVDSAITQIKFNFFWIPQTGLVWSNDIPDVSMSEISSWSFNVQEKHDSAGDRLTITMNAPDKESFATDSLFFNVIELRAIMAKDGAHAPIDLYVDSLMIVMENENSFVQNTPYKIGFIRDKADSTGTPPPPFSNNARFHITKPDFVVGNSVFPLLMDGPVLADSGITGFRFKLEWDVDNFFDIISYEKTELTDTWSFETMDVEGQAQISLIAPGAISLKDSAEALLNLTASVIQPDFDTQITFFVRDMEIRKGESFMMADSSKMEIGRSIIKGKSSGSGGSSGSGSAYGGFYPLLTSDSGRVNNGLYGGRPLDFAWDEVNQDVYIATEGASSVYVSADSGRTWTSPFPNDSLEWYTEVERRGWGGRGVQIVASGGYVYSVTVENGGTLNSSQVKRPGFDFVTLLHQSEAQSIVSVLDSSIQAKFNFIDARENHVIIGSDNYLLRSDDGGYYWGASLVPNKVSAKSYSIQQVALLSDTTSHFVVVAQQNFGTMISHLFKTTDAATFTPITPLNGADTLSVEALTVYYQNPDTMFVTARNVDHSPNGVWRSLNGGSTWTKVKDFSTTVALSDPLPHVYAYEVDGASRVIINDGAGHQELSSDLGTTFKTISGKNDPVSNVVTANSIAQLHIPGTRIFFGDGDNAPTRSTGGLQGTYIPVPQGIEAVNVWQIAQAPGALDTVYLATSSGIGYTTKYTDATITGTAKWAPPYGQFPINPNNGGNTGFTAIQVNENNANHVVAANGNGIFASFTGGATNGSWTATDFTTISGLDITKVKDDGGMVTDIVFVNSDTLYASLTCSRTLYGALLASYDGGQNWSLHTGVSNSHSYNGLKKATQGSTTYLYLASGGTFDAVIDSGAVYRSVDHGKTWSLRGYMSDASLNPLGFPMPVNDLEAYPGSLDTLYFAAGTNLSNVIAVTFDGGSTFTSLFGGYEGAFEALAINKNNPDSVYFAVRRNIFVYDAVAANTDLLFRGFPGELTHDLLYDDLTQASSGGFFNISNPDLASTRAHIEDYVSTNPNEVELFQNYPNPFNPTTTIKFKLPANATVELAVYNVLGQRVAHLVNNQKLQSGLHQIPFNASALSSGVYFYTLKTGNRVMTKKMLLIK